MNVVYGGSKASRTYARSSEVKDGALDLFTVPPTNITCNGYRIVEINPTSESITPVEFVLPGSREYLDFSRRFFCMELTLKKAECGNLAAADGCWLAPNAFHTIIKQPSLYVNGVLTTEQTHTYAYKAYLETVLSHEIEEEEKTLKPQGYYSALDHPLHTLTGDQMTKTHNDYKALNDEQKKAVDGALVMRARTVGGKTIQLYGMPHVDLFNTGRMLILGVDMKIRFTLNELQFFVNGLATQNTDVRLEAGDLKMKFFACFVKVRLDVYNGIATARFQRNLDMSYPTVRSEIRTYTLQNNHINFEATDVFNGRVPDRVVVGVVYQDAFSGTDAYNPFIFKKDKITSLKQVVEGEEYLYLLLNLDEDSDKDMEG